MNGLPILSIVLALIAAFLFACASVAQQSAAAAVPEGQSLITTLLRSPRWWAGLCGDVGGYGFQVAALWAGSVLIVQPLIVSMLLFALPLSAKFAGYRMTRSSWVWAVALAIALTVFIGVGDPTEGNSDAPFSEWMIPLAIASGLVLAATLAGLLSTNPGWRALLLGAAGGLLFGMAVALTKYVTDLLGTDLAKAVTAWQTYALVGCGILGFYLQQRAFQSGPLSASLPAITIGEPFGAAFLGITVLDERIRDDAFSLVVIAVCVTVMVVATVALSRAQAKVTGHPVAQ
ncbi:DMT family transporter [Rhodococcus sp. H36-A4]|uniref:DMT family transporter n=1 Tax=Rhodococcus sp. H36-A4 TaxID=3004353 RepID=UPI0022B01416|nr:DMT family transporter [Rhodococcus sp. H36-A4]MCZ4079887.1 DMT family transporter [Rhodococcus sp. H36-A4]